MAIKENIMESQGSVTRRYNNLINDVATLDFYKTDLTNRVNCYSCSDGHITKTKDVDAGVTPMMITCETCNKTAHSSFYRDIAPLQQPTVEWYRPSLKETLKMRKKPNSLEHVLSGGLIYRKVKVQTHSHETPRP